jgi:hypothetical protein
MRTRLCLLTAAIALVAAGAPAAAAAPFGHFGGKVGGGNAGSGLMPLHGWALDDGGVEAVDIVVAPCAPPVSAGRCNFNQGFVAGRANYGRSRPGVTQRYPGYPDSAAPGFAYSLDTTRYANGLYRVWPRVRSLSGEVVNLKPLLLEFLNNDTALMPFGAVEFPEAGAEMSGNCNLADPSRRYSVVSGYAMDVGMTQEDRGIGYVELLIDRAIYARSEVDCVNLPAAGGLSNCYGIRRLDLAPFFPNLKDDPHVGFRFVIDTGVLLYDPDGPGPMAALYPPGHHLITIRAGDNADQIANIAEFHVTFRCADGNEEAIGEIVSPNPLHPQAGTVMASGWALDWEGVHSVQVLVDGIPVTYASYGLVVPGVNFAALYPGYPDSVAPGWVALIDTTALSNGEHQLEVLVIDDHGNTTFIGGRKLTVNNPGH